MPTPREVFTNTVERQGYSGARVRAADFGAAGEMIGRAAQGFGQDLSKVAGDITEIAKRDAETAAQEADNIRVARRLKRLYGDPETGEKGFFNQEGKGALLDYETLNADLKKIDDEAAEVIKNKPFARKMYDDISLKRANDDMPRISQFVAKERTKHEDLVDADAFDLSIDNASSSLDPAVVEENIQTAGNIAVRQMMRKGMLDDNALRQARQSGEGKAIAAVAEQLNLKSPSEAQAFVVLNAKRMDPQDAAKLLETLAPTAAKEQADEMIGDYLVTTNDQLQANPQAEPNPVVPSVTAPTSIPNFDAVAAALLQQETRGGAHTNPDGTLIRSYAGAAGTGQIMPKTGPKPGYGVKPLQNNSQQEHVRFSKDLLAAYTKHFGGNIVLGLTAYNWGPGNLENHIKEVGDPSKGQISDAAFVNSLPKVKGPTEAARNQVRTYAESILGRVGVQVGGGRVDPSVAQAPTYQGQEINLAATFSKIDASDLTYMQKQALKDSASRQHSLGRQAKVEAEDRLKDAVWTEINKLGEGFTNYDKLPIALRQQLATNPTLEASIRNQATTNENQRLARIEAQNNDQRTEDAETAALDLMELEFSRPDEFLRTDLRTFPGLSHADRTAAMSRQQTLRKSREPGQTGTVDHDRVRREINKFAPHYKIDPKKDDQKLGQAYTTAIVMAQNLLKQNGGKPLNDAQVEGIARTVMMPVRLNVKGAGDKVVPRYQMGTTAREIGRDKITGTKTNVFGAVKADIQVKEGRTPSDAEVQERMRQLGLL